VQLALIDSDTSQIYVWRNQTFETYSPTTDKLPTASHSAAWYQHQRDHLDFAEIRPLQIGETRCVLSTT
jgi:hypothetical protein